jgi:hypothetical protein
MVKRKKYKPWKTVVFWVSGAVCASIASLIAGNINPELLTEFKPYISLLIAMFFFLLAGLFWIAVSVAAKESD